ncbi:3-deoxy-D-manno-octulosonic acid kinase [Saccharobesus litoralis]|uniref:3-deoxy-D-manno-octulosonic acid kinase n=1 Tax=Saccharobesus litoralis TaxID=2172099 RepID=UPI00131EEDEE|nr:3-deoxy-D-manno-octulosonic acid kinase [Saccharobesus litoralis]
MPLIQTFANQETIITSEHYPASFEISSDSFTPEYWQKNNKVIGQSIGRNTTYFFQQGSDKYVLRHYYRGGLPGKIFNDTYVYAGLKRTRMYKEFCLLEQLQQLDLPAPKMIGARILRDKHLYRGDLIMQQIPDAEDLYHLLQHTELEKADWHRIGRTLADFHKAGIFHADLNIHNVMMDMRGKVWVIDFDRGRQTQPKFSWQHSNMLRLKRSFDKEKAKHPNMFYKEDNWRTLSKAYQKRFL